MAVTFTASLLLLSAGKALVSSGISWAISETGSWAAGRFLDHLTSDPNAKVTRADIYGVVREMQLIQSSLDDLTDTLSNGIISIRLDTLNQPMAQIQAHYKTVADILDTAYDIAERNLTESEHERQMGRLQQRLDDRLQACANNIPGWLTQIHNFLNANGERAFMRQLSQQAWNESPDLVAYYSRSKTVVLDYWITVSKGIDLLQIAHGAQGVRFDEGQRAIDRHIRQLLDQERNFVRFIGNETIRLAETILLDPSSPHPFFWEINQDTYAAAEDVGATQTRISVNTRNPVEWRMDPWPPVNLETFDPLRGYPVALNQVGQRGIMCPGGRHGLALEPFARPTCTWSIKPREPGNNRYSFKFISGLVRQANNGYYMITRPSAGVPGRIMSLLTRLHREDGSHFFYVKPQGLAATS
ncbi:hypothetical protein FOQG_12570 [Fusarium oxysporum f. sp. raphani 54005]|uniref:Uncharacterized protein n=2 Tax=Fusarium oxysporum f. sp. raphani TaxID=96318 RepID=X0BWD1_FUSOX|nr:hypothetical protein FOQG_12570 [Fusarium oxysporum f. sp. raphani 54005]KAG7425898.1 hypothetical protein Forpi1262_v013534 [Fusarium oxysporum f. sp. raphani]